MATIKIMNISRKIRYDLPKPIYKILKLIGRQADSLNYNAFCVGGFVRDLLLGIKNFDIDIAVEQDAVKFAKILAKKLSGSLVVHKRFGTATVYYKGGNKIDIATARTEIYKNPAALPEVKFSSIREDLCRRDFTINAMAICINKSGFGELVDFFNGRQDLQNKKIRALHDLSFVDDPTRIFRAVRFEQRYNFKIEPYTEELIKTAVNLDMVAKTQKQRIRDEIILILSEDKPVKALRRMNELHELRFIDPNLKLTKNMPRLFESIEKAVIRYRLSFTKKRPLNSWIIYFMAMINPLSVKSVKLICEKFVFRKGDEKRLLSCKMKAEGIKKILDKKSKLLPSRIYRHLEPLSYEVIIFIMANAKTNEAKRRISLFFSEHNGARLKISGADLKKINLAPGPKYKKILDKILYAKIDGKVRTKQDEVRLAKKLI